MNMNSVVFANLQHTYCSIDLQLDNWFPFIFPLFPLTNYPIIIGTVLAIISDFMFNTFRFINPMTMTIWMILPSGKIKSNQIYSIRTIHSFASFRNNSLLSPIHRHFCMPFIVWKIALRNSIRVNIDDWMQHNKRFSFLSERNATFYWVKSNKLDGFGV